jgi:DNA-binding NarL/FixJ family response regulator
MTIRVMIVDDHKILREGLLALINGETDMRIVGQAGDGLSALAMAKDLRPDIVVMDVAMARINGMAATHELKVKMPEIKVIALSMHSDRRFVTGMMDAGASGYLLKDSAFEELVSALRTVASGRTYFSPRIADSVSNSRHERSKGAAGSPMEMLTLREREVLQLIAEGHNTKQIAGLLDISVKTVESHRKHLMERLGLHNVADLTRLAVQEGLASLAVTRKS